MDITDLEQGYAGLIAEARLGGFSAPARGEWTAEQIIAHVAAIDGFHRPAHSCAPWPNNSPLTTPLWCTPPSKMDRRSG
jgi:hypothetical protein